MLEESLFIFWWDLLTELSNGKCTFDLSGLVVDVDWDIAGDVPVTDWLFFRITVGW